VKVVAVVPDGGATLPAVRAVVAPNTADGAPRSAATVAARTMRER
jgi:hypothetical protein